MSQNQNPEMSLYELLGGEASLKKLVADFYDFMDTESAVRGIRDQHQSDLTEAREKLFMFLTGWTGGPQLYINAHGHPRLRARHLPFKIGESERDQWMLCMRHALGLCSTPETIKLEFYKSLFRLADHMRNQPG